MSMSTSTTTPQHSSLSSPSSPPRSVPGGTGTLAGVGVGVGVGVKIVVAPEQVGFEEADATTTTTTTTTATTTEHRTPTIALLPSLDVDPNRNGNRNRNPPSPPSPSPPSSSNQPQTQLAVATLSSPWQYDEVQPNCSNPSCRSTFTLLNRRHHCRLCGHVFCHNCTDRKALVPPSQIVLAPIGGKKVPPPPTGNISFTPNEDPDRMLTYMDPNDKALLYGRGLEERFHLAREPLRVCHACHMRLQPLQPSLISANSNAVRFNAIDPTDARRLWNSPLAFTLGHEIRKAAYTLNNLLPLPRRLGPLLSGTSGPHLGYTNQQQHCKEECSAFTPTLGHLDGVRIPARLLEQAKGVAVMTVAKGGFGVAGVEFGTGLVVARLGEGMWSAPSALGTAGLSWGALIGAQVSDHVFLLMTDAAVELLFRQSSITLGADVGIAVGPLGRSAEADLGAASPDTIAPIYTYSLSKGLYAGISLDGKVLVTRDNVNERFYGRPITGAEILGGRVPTPPAAQPLYEALARCHVYATGNVRTTANTPTAAAAAASDFSGFYPQPSTLLPPPWPSTLQYPNEDPITRGEYGELAPLHEA